MRKSNGGCEGNKGCGYLFPNRPSGFRSGSFDRKSAVLDAPEIQRCQRSVRGIPLPVRFKLRLGKVAETVQHHDAAADAEILITEDVRPAEGKDQQHFRSPDSDAFQCDQFPDDPVIGFPGKGLEINDTAPLSFRNAAEIFDFAAGKTAGAQIFEFGGKQILRGDLAQQIFQSLKDDISDFDRKLLGNDALHQGKEKIGTADKRLQFRLPDDLPEFGSLPAKGFNIPVRNTKNLHPTILSQWNFRRFAP